MPARLAARVFRTFEEFTRLETAGGIVLLIAAAVALAWANSPWVEHYDALWNTPVVVGVDGFGIAKSLHHWVNDGLMAVFFFVVGLEIKREVLVGELAAPRRAALPVIAALGGMLVPAAIYLALNLGGPGGRGWAIPTATDIAFAIGVLALVGDRVPLSLKVFLTALAIADDLGAVLVIALFYTADLSLQALGAAGVIYLVMIATNFLGIRRIGWYGLLGVALWVAFLKSGVHATVAGVLAAMAIPASARIDKARFRLQSRALLDEFEMLDRAGDERSINGEQQDRIYGLAAVLQHVETPLQRLEHALLPWVTFGIMPLFALANGGLVLTGGVGQLFQSPVTLGVVLGLILGKPLGILGFAWLAITIGVAERPAGASWRQLAGVGVLAGIGFTMSLFIAGLAFGETLLHEAKTGILLASLVAGVGGAVLIVTAAAPAQAAERP
jgi:Na+:H+ antiporter, NhaA family